MNSWFPPVRKHADEPGPIQFDRDELIELDALLIPEQTFCQRLIDDADYAGVTPKHLHDRIALLNGIRAKIAGEMEDQDL